MGPKSRDKAFLSVTDAEVTRRWTRSQSDTITNPGETEARDQRGPSLDQLGKTSPPCLFSLTMRV